MELKETRFNIPSIKLLVDIMTEMSQTEIRKFLNKGTFTGKLATVKKDGSSHVVPIWFVLDYRKLEIR
jgi:nitroimidazol reductase NimA-like FMN-containing flavoprotein (pyridoxamine 5'-phosphate oxidase superfamily)